MTNYKNTMVIYESAYLAIGYLPDDSMKWEAMEGLLRYGFYGEMPESDNPFINMVYVQALPSMQNAKQRYEKAVENGKKGGRPTEVSTEEIMEMKKNGMTNKQIADKLGCSVKNIENRVTAYNKAYPNNPNNLSVSVSVSESVSASVSVASANEEVANAKKEERSIEDLSEEEAREIIKKLKNNEKYIDIQKQYNLKYGSVTKDFEKQWNKIKANQSYWAEQEAEMERRKNEPQIDYKRIYSMSEASSKKKREEERQRQTDLEEIINDVWEA